MRQELIPDLLRHVLKPFGPSHLSGRCMLWYDCMSTPEEMKQLRSDTLRSIVSTEIEMLPRVRRTHLHTSVQRYFQDARTIFDTLHLKFKVGKCIDKYNRF
jgi:hypothetical protein